MKAGSTTLRFIFVASIKLTGLNKLLKKFQRRPDEIQKLTAAAINIEAEIIMAKAKVLTPVDLGTLRSTGFVKPPKFRRSKISISLGFGGPAAEYALFVHEDLTANHVVGQAKFLEEPFKQSLSGMSTRIAKRVENGLT